LVVALAIAVGVYSVGVIVDIQQMLMREYGNDQDGALIATATYYTSSFDDDLAVRIAEIPGIAAASGRNQIRTYAYDARGDRKELRVNTVSNFENPQVDVVTPISGSWPPSTGEITLERLALEYLDVAVGDTLILELEDGATKQLLVGGTVHDPQEFSPLVFKRSSGYVLPETMEKLGFGAEFSQMRVRVEDDVDDESKLESILKEVENQIERSGRPVYDSQIRTEGPQDAIMDTVILMLSVFAVIILLLSGFLVVNAISALITQQVQQIGVMKLIGAGRPQIVIMYLVTALAYGLIAVLIGLPLGVFSAQMLMSDIVEPILNVNSESLSISFGLAMFQVVIGLLIPVLAGILPVLNGTSITTRKALTDTGISANVQEDGLAERFIRAIQRVRPVHRPFLLSFRNTLRHKGRLLQTLFVLIMGTALFISVTSVNTSVNATLESFMRHHQYDVSVALAHPYRIEPLERAAQALPEVEYVESWSIDNGVRLRQDDSESEPFQVYAVPANSNFIDPQMELGHWLVPGQTSGLVVNSDVMDKENDIEIGREIRLDIDGRELVAPVVGVIRTDSQGAAVYMTLAAYMYLTRTPGEATHIQVAGVNRETGATDELKERLFQQLESTGFEVSSLQTAQQINSSNELMFTLIVTFLILMALLLAAVGGLGLTTTMSINILERIREIGVLRAIGASNVSVRQIILAEGLVIGLVSWASGLLLSFPLSAFLSDQIGLALLKTPLTFRYSTISAIVWFFALMLIAFVASLGPARGAVRLTIREVLAYE
jgi:putative ABC transport system permease protein